MRVGLKPKEVTALLRERGFKVTPQRLAVYNALAHTTEHPSAETLYQELLPDYPTMSLATVYKSLNILCAVGLVQELNVGEDSFRYDARVSPHPHIRCMHCGRVDDVKTLPTTDFSEQVMLETGYQLTGQQYYFYGVCPHCQQTMLAQEA